MLKGIKDILQYFRNKLNESEQICAICNGEKFVPMEYDETNDYYPLEECWNCKGKGTQKFHIFDA